MKILVLTSSITKKIPKTSADGLQHRMESTEQRISELEDKTIGSIQSEHQRENRL